MLIQLASDLHLDRLGPRFAGQTLIRPAAAADLLVLAGDVSATVDGVARFAHWPVPVLYVPGNHEYFDADWAVTRRELALAAQGTAVTVLDSGQWVYAGVRFLGCTLWTDYALETEASQAEQMRRCGQRIRDHAVIHVGSRLFTPEDALAEHLRCRRWLEQCLAQPFDGPTVVISHHAPSPRSVHPRFAGHPVNPAYASRLDDLACAADLWLHGHVHDSFDYVLRAGDARACRVVANPCGYARRRDQALQARDLSLENEAFAWECLLRI